MEGLEQGVIQMPPSPRSTCIGLGCGPGAISAELTARGVRVTGIDANSELLTAARKRCPTAVFENQDLNNLKLQRNSFDGLWSSFAVAYLADLERILSSWVRFLASEAWLCVVEIDDLLCHDPLSRNTHSLIEAFYEDAFKKKRYDFRAGRKIRPTLENLGLEVEEFELADQELSFEGAAPPEIVQAWRNRFNRMGGLKTFLGDKHADFVEEFIHCISSDHHRTHCKVLVCVGTRPKELVVAP